MIGPRPSWIDHVVILVHLENLESARISFGELLALEWDGPYDITERGFRIFVSWDGGIELMAVTDASLAVEQADHLAHHGEGLYRLIFGVPDIEQALERARALGVDGARRIDGLQIDPSWSKRFKRIDEASLPSPGHGVRLTLAQIEPR
jgi:4-hydroxyphenylpyruvate dioxygenase-like putative hemolysin